MKVRREMDKVGILILFFVGWVLFYAGLQTGAEEQAVWKVAQELLSVLANIATIVALFLAYKAYSSWKKQITHAKLFDKDIEALNKLDLIQDKVEFFSLYQAYQLLYLYQNALNFKDRDIIGARAEVKAMREMINESKITSVFNEFNGNVRAELHAAPSIEDDFSQSLKDYRACLKTYILTVHSLLSDASSSLLEDSEKVLRKIKNLQDEGELYQNLLQSHDKVKDKFNDKWFRGS
ncbi:hypothetical protein CGH31_07710 [Vibrio parahaemolyticus]|nr:hypothetical protein CCD93_15730 [Vibrio sp. T21]TOO69973.1 hypothetical protein CGH31_07710 [Vibrio parahaemolyticus]